MSNYNSAATNYGSGTLYTMSWTAPQSTLNLSDNGYQAWARFTSATAILAGSVSAATLTISGIGAPGTAETITVKADKTNSDAGLPVDYMDAFFSRTKSTASATTGDLSAETSVNLDVTSVIQELVAAIDGDEILLVFEDLTYSGSGLAGMTATLDITYTGGGGGGSVVANFMASPRRVAVNRASSW